MFKLNHDMALINHTTQTTVNTAPNDHGYCYGYGYRYRYRYGYR